MKFYFYSNRQILRGEAIAVSFTVRGKVDPINMNGSQWELVFSANPEFSSTLLTINSSTSPGKVSIENNGSRCSFLLNGSETNSFPRGLIYMRLRAQVPSGATLATLKHLSMEVG